MNHHTNCHCLQAVVYNWSCSPSCDGALTTDISSKADLFLPGPLASPFVPGMSYSFTVTTNFVNSSVVSTDSVTVVFDAAPIQAVLTGTRGYVNIGSSTARVILDACSSKSPDNATAALVYSFTCWMGPESTPCPNDLGRTACCHWPI